jgi:hypothetical protein
MIDNCVLGIKELFTSWDQSDPTGVLFSFC